MEQVIIGVVDNHEAKLGQGRFSTDRAGYTSMRTYAKEWPARVWAVEGATGAGRSLAQRLLEVSTTGTACPGPGTGG